MFKSFFPSPKQFFLSAIAWSLACVFVWYIFGDQIGRSIGFDLAQPDAPDVVGIHYFWTQDFLWFYVYFVASTVPFLFLCHRIWPHPWFIWSVVGSVFILFSTYFSVQVSVAINNWRRPFFDLVQTALSGDRKVPASEFYQLLLVFVELASAHITVLVITTYIVQHYVFRWRTAMNDYYLAQWSEVRHIEGASQRIQEDTMRFAGIMEGLGVRLVDSVMTLFAFLPILLALSEYVTTLPIVGEIPSPLVSAALTWSVFGTLMLVIAGIRLPGLEFKNQRVEAAFRKELVYGEDDENRAKPPTVKDLFSNVRKNYFRLYLNYLYFNVARYFYIQADNIFVLFILIPTISAGAITFGIFQQIVSAFNQVSNSFQYLVNSWSTIVELLSIHKRLMTFEAAIRGEALPDIDAEYLARIEETPDPLAEDLRTDRP